MRPECVSRYKLYAPVLIRCISIRADMFRPNVLCVFFGGVEISRVDRGKKVVMEVETCQGKKGLAGGQRVSPGVFMASFF